MVKHIPLFLYSYAMVTMMIMITSPFLLLLRPPMRVKMILIIFGVIIVDIVTVLMITIITLVTIVMLV